MSDRLARDFAQRLVAAITENFYVAGASTFVPNSSLSCLSWKQHEIQAQRDRKLEAAREQRKNRRQRVA